MPGVVSDAGQPFDHLRHPRQRPQIRGKAAGTSARKQGPLEIGELPWRDSRGPARRAAAAQPVLATLLPAAIPAADVLAADAQLAGDLCLGDLAGEQRRGLKADPLLEIAVARRAPTDPATALLGRHDPSSHTNTST